MGNLLPLMPFACHRLLEGREIIPRPAEQRTRSVLAAPEEAAKMANSNQIPKLEHGASETALRVLWKFVKNHDSESDVGIGALLSSVLDTPEQIGDADLEEYVPAALYYTPGEELVHSWNYLPFFFQNNA